VAKLRDQVAKLQKAIDVSSHQINARQVASVDELESENLEAMVEIHETSIRLKDQATVRLDFLTSFTEDASEWMRNSNQELDRIASLAAIEEHVDSDIRLYQDGNMSTSSPTAEWGKVPFNINTMTDASATAALQSPQPSTSSSDNDGSVPTSTLNHEKVLNLDQLSAETFKTRIDTILEDAAAVKMGTSKPFSDEIMDTLAGLLYAVGKHAWSERPRTYLVLRLIDEVKAMDNFVLGGLKDIDFPYSDATIPACIKGPMARHGFMQKQRYVLSERSSDLVKEGRHRHLGNEQYSRL
jgi:hypothetical protein